MTRSHESWSGMVKEDGGSIGLDRSGTGKRASGSGKDTEMSDGDTWAEFVMGTPLDDDDNSFSEHICLLSYTVVRMVLFLRMSLSPVEINMKVICVSLYRRAPDFEV